MQVTVSVESADMDPCLDLFSINGTGDLACVQVAGAFNVNDCESSRTFFAQKGNSYLLMVYGYNEQLLGGDFNLSVTTSKGRRQLQ